jgi:hypothetical protein
MYTNHLLSSVATIQPKLELKTRPKPLLGSLLLVIALPGRLLYKGPHCWIIYDIQEKLLDRRQLKMEKSVPSFMIL